MRSVISKTLALVAICTTLLSFSLKPGGEGFEIYLNNKVLLQRYGNDMNVVQSLQLNQAAPNDQLIIRYHHCGKIGKNRVITIKDAQDNSLKEFRYADALTPVAAMVINTKEIMNLKKSNRKIFKLYYSSTELPNGRMLATLNVGAKE